MSSLQHDRDFYAWATDSAACLRAGRWAEVDVDQIAEELEDMGKQQKHALAGHLKILILHLLKWRYQPGLRGVSWRRWINNARDEIAELLEDSPSLATKLPEIATRRYPAARSRASLETGLTLETFPAQCPFTVDQLLDPDHLPD
ncbi:DUF29 domain-containing protein [uncultured Thiodictyon sp.]|uniref:DUF29 domain-containing protein n=1 Tax=uncultured Thiodictyon sp. TaxID=1846217 RepID=UPI0025F3043C|nr:DUF29 domain-containing protein [uncultured Thiodictyon sp.]